MPPSMPILSLLLLTIVLFALMPTISTQMPALDIYCASRPVGCNLECPFGFRRRLDRTCLCVCLESPCSSKNCSLEQTCLVRKTGTRLVAICEPNIAEKVGHCPSTSAIQTRSCRSECSNDHQCSGVNKCCPNECAFVCVGPDKATDCIHLVSAIQRLPSRSLHTGYVPKCSIDGTFESVQCDRSFCWCVRRKNGLPVPGTRIGKRAFPPNCRFPKICAPVSCSVENCPFGLVTDFNGCPLPSCECHDICRGVSCSKPFEVCQLVEPDCRSSPCSPVPRCLVNPCPNGLPMTLPETGVTALCRHTTQCSGQYWCHKVGYNGLGFCCPRPSSEIRAGSCPAELPVESLTSACSSRCRSDPDCPSGAKCCFDGCGFDCLPPIDLPPSNPPNSNPSTVVVGQSLNNRLQIKNADRAPIVGRSKQGRCPLDGLPPIGVSVCMDDCTHDRDCPGPTICCSIGCSRSCAFPIENQPNVLTVSTVIKEGLCPSTIRVSPLVANSCHQSCQTDGDCSRNDKCCRVGCASLCVTPKAFPRPNYSQKLGFCPSIVQNNRENCLTDLSTCKNDSNCPRLKKCCSNGCNRSCIYPKRTTACLHLKAALERIGASEYTPNCSEIDGTFEPIQCDGSFCWCSTKNGKEAIGTRIRIQRGVGPNCAAARNCRHSPLCPHLNCQYGFELDFKGCPTCQCRNLCRSIRCPEPIQICTVESVPCSHLNQSSNCLVPVPKCIVNACPQGRPLVHPATLSPFNCDQSQPCTSPLSFCHFYKPGQGYCCPKPEISHRPGECPTLPPDQSGVCVNKCRKDDDCPVMNKCCFNGCGMSCQSTETTTVPLITLDRKIGECPVLTINLTGCTDEQIDQCQTDRTCPEIRKCCSDGCSKKCIYAHMTTACHHRKAAATEISNSFIHQCEINGSFVPVQRLGDIRWCVDNEGMEIPGTRGSSSTPPCHSPRPCPIISCNLRCPLGYTLNDDGCEQCACLDPCKDVTCSHPFQVCRLVSQSCYSSACPPVPKCIVNACPNGVEPLKNSETWQLMKCDPNHICPLGHFCHTIGLESSHVGYCCPGFASATLLTRQTCPFTHSLSFLTDEHLCRIECTSYLDCQSDHLESDCCFNGCGTSCTRSTRKLNAITGVSIMGGSPSIDKLGSCPLNRITNPECTTECDQDEQCQGFEKCCPFGCGRKCQAPEIATPAHSCQIRCPSDQCPFGLELDSNGCPKNDLCQCKDHCKTIKCPRIDDICLLESTSCDSPPCPPKPTCKSNPCESHQPLRDTQERIITCSGNFENHCGIGAQCRPIPDDISVGICCTRNDSSIITDFGSKIGECPDKVPNTIPLIGCTNKCTNDNGCSNELKCCQFGCNSLCVPPVISADFSSTHCLRYKTAIETLINTGQAQSSVYMPTCEQTSGLYQSTQCNSWGQCWCVDRETGIEVLATKTVLSDGQNACAQIRRNCAFSCSNHATVCPFGIVTTKDGCPIDGNCQCFDPCRSISCSPGNVCVLRSGKCSPGDSCTPVPTCEPNHCIRGQKPAVEPRIHTLLTCARNGTRKCPPAFHCAGFDQFNLGVCCAGIEPSPSKIEPHLLVCDHGEPFSNAPDGLPLQCSSSKNSCPSTHDCYSKSDQLYGICCVSKYYACNLPNDPGPCTVSVQKYFYDTESQTCQQFTFGGCGGNENNFVSKNDCDKFCIKKEATILDELAENSQKMELIRMGFSLSGPLLRKKHELTIMKAFLNYLTSNFGVRNNEILDLSILDDNSVQFSIHGIDTVRQARLISDAVSESRLHFIYRNNTYRAEPQTLFSERLRESDRQLTTVIFWGVLVSCLLFTIFFVGALATLITCLYRKGRRSRLHSYLSPANAQSLATSRQTATKKQNSNKGNLDSEAVLSHLRGIQSDLYTSRGTIPRKVFSTDDIDNLRRGSYYSQAQYMLHDQQNEQKSNEARQNAILYY